MEHSRVWAARPPGVWSGARPAGVDPTEGGLIRTRRVVATLDPQTTALAERLLRLTLRGLPRMYRGDTGEFAFTRAGVTESGGEFTTELRGTSLRYSAMVALGLYWLPEPLQQRLLRHRPLRDFISDLIGRVGPTTNLGDAAVVCWAAAQAAHPRLDRALDLLRRLDTSTQARYVIEAAWVVSALATARTLVDVEAHLARARSRLLGSLMPGRPLFPHATGPGLVRWYRSHVASFADQVNPIQALARLHRSGDEPAALAAAQACAAHICQLQGSGGQWWWHYDVRTGDVIEGYPVYSVHQHAMAPMALLDLADSGGARHTEAIRRGFGWLAAPPELAPGGEQMIIDEHAMTWRKVHRGDPHKMVRGLHAVSSRFMPGWRVPLIDRIYRPTAIDRECRPYELGWFLFGWLGGLASTPTPTPAADLAAPPESAV